jgi:hypothetical protein
MRRRVEQIPEVLLHLLHRGEIKPAQNLGVDPSLLLPPLLLPEVKGKGGID